MDLYELILLLYQANPKSQWLTATDICFSSVFPAGGFYDSISCVFSSYSSTQTEGSAPTWETWFPKAKDRPKHTMAFEASARNKPYVIAAHILLAKINHMANPDINRAKDTPQTQEALKVTLP